MSLLDITLWAHAGATLAMVGLIWFVQVVHYPLFAHAGSEFGEVHRGHMEKTGRVVVPFMVVELAAAIALLVLAPAHVRPLTVSGLMLLAVVWGATFFLQVPLHRRLASAPSSPEADIRALVRTNWVRTIGWTARGPIALALLAGA